MNKIEKAIKLIDTNKENISQILVSEEFMLKIAKFPSKIKIDVRSVELSKNDTAEIYFLFGVPLTYSNILTSGAVLVMKNGENIILKNL